MKGLHKLKSGTPLMWEADTTEYVGGKQVPKKILYPIMKMENCSYNKVLGAMIISSNSSNWMGFENEHIRHPSEQELLEHTEAWEQMKLKHRPPTGTLYK